MEKDISFLLTNGLRNILIKTFENKNAINYNIQETIENENVAYFIIITIGGITFSIIMALITIRQIFQTYSSKNNLLKIFTLMSFEDIRHAYNL